jgi:3-oxoacyl-[acyl-carrier-protein] synthase-3
MKQIHAAITAVNGWVPEHKLTNADLEKMVETNDEWILSRTGISERRIMKEPGTGSSDIAVPAVLGLLEKRGIGADELDMIIVCTATPDMPVPATANILAHKIGAKNAFHFDLNAACSGFIYGLTVGAKFVESGSHKKVLVVGVDKMSSIIDYTDRRTCIIFGDGCGAVLLEPNTEGLGFIDAEHKSDGVGCEYLNVKAGGSVSPASHLTVDNKEHFVFQEGQVVFKWAVKGMVDTLKTVMQRNNLSVDQVDWVIPHQANRRIIDSVASMGDFPSEKVIVNIQKYGNTTNGTIPLCLWEWEDKFKKGDTILLTAFGGGFTWGSVMLRWAY